MHFSSTDLPVPEPPITTTDLALADVEVEAVQHPLGAEALVQAADPDLGGSGCGGRARGHRLKNISVTT